MNVAYAYDECKAYVKNQDYKITNLRPGINRDYQATLAVKINLVLYSTMGVSIRMIPFMIYEI